MQFFMYVGADGSPYIGFITPKNKGVIVHRRNY